jgi:hypothetical protein
VNEGSTILWWACEAYVLEVGIFLKLKFFITNLRAALIHGIFINKRI